MSRWDGSDRRSRLPDNWLELRQSILKRDPICQVCRAEPSTQVDHVRAGDNHDPSNLQGSCSKCHDTKTAREGLRAQGYLNKREPEQHPGLIPGG